MCLPKFLYVKENSKEICEEICFPSNSFFRKMLMSAFLLRFKAIYLEEINIGECSPMNTQR